MTIKDQQYLLHALSIAQSRRGFCAPNPAVGAVVIKDQQVIATGVHLKAGCDHAERDALNKLNDAAGATLYVTLEPCNHQGRTSPCTEIILDKHISRVVYGFKDPNPHVAGGGAAFLRQQGVEVSYVQLDAVDAFYQSYVHWLQTGLPFVTAKLAVSADDKIAADNGEPVQITGEACRVLTHQYRLCSDAILTTAKTVLADDPQLNVRLDEETIAKDIYVIDRQHRLSGQEKIYSTAKSVTVIGEENCGLLAVLKQIGSQGVHDLWVEAGGQLFCSLVQSGFVQKSLLYRSNKPLGEQALSAFSQDFDIMANMKNTREFDCGQDRVCEIIYEV